MPPMFVDARELADRLEVGYETVLSWVRRGKLPHIRDGRGRLLFNLDSVIRALNLRPEESSRRPLKGGIGCRP